MRCDYLRYVVFLLQAVTATAINVIALNAPEKLFVVFLFSQIILDSAASGKRDGWTMKI